MLPKVVTEKGKVAAVSPKTGEIQWEKAVTGHIVDIIASMDGQTLTVIIEDVASLQTRIARYFFRLPFLMTCDE